ncbi:stationary-phase-induced ribosome-associated protein [Providencia alcalifaciens]
MVSNNSARRLLGMPYKLSRSKKNIRVSIGSKDNIAVAVQKTKQQKRKHIIQLPFFTLNM